MAVIYNGLFGTNSSKVGGTSITIDPADITVAVGDDLFIGLGTDTGGTNYTVTRAGTASVSISLEHDASQGTEARAIMWRMTITGAGTITSITISWTGSIDAKAAVAGWFSGVGTRDSLSDHSGPGTLLNVILHGTTPWQSEDLLIGTAAWEATPSGDTYAWNEVGEWTTAGVAEIGRNGTAGGGAASNMTCTMGYGIASENSVTNDGLTSTDTTSRDCVGVGGIYSPAAAAAPGPIFKRRPGDRFMTRR